MTKWSIELVSIASLDVPAFFNTPALEKNFQSADMALVEMDGIIYNDTGGGVGLDIVLQVDSTYGGRE